MISYGPYSSIVSETTTVVVPPLVSNNPAQHLYIHSPSPIFKARVNLPSATYPLTSLPFDSVTLGSYTAILPDMTMTVGTTEGADDLGRVRVQSAPSSTAIPIGRVSRGLEDGTLEADDNAYITVWDDFRVWAKIPYLTPTVPSIHYKDGNVAVGDNMELPPPVANMGAGVGDTIDPDTGLITVAFDATNSIAVADGATITFIGWNTADGTVIAGATDTANVTCTFPPGFRYVTCTAVDSNGKSHLARAPIVARDPDDDICVPFQVTQESRSLTGGSRVAFRIFEDLPRNIYPDGTLCMWWSDTRLDEADRSHMRLIGWEQSSAQSISANETRLLRNTTLECVDVGGRLQTLPGFPQTVEKPDAGDDPSWDKMPAPTIDKYIHHLLHWHSNALTLADYTPSGTGSTYPFLIFQSEGANLYEQVDRKARNICPDHRFLITRLGGMRVEVDPMLQNVADRSALTQGSFIEQWWNDLRLTYSRPPKVHTMRASALIAATDWILVGDQKTLETAFSIAPGTTPSQGTAESMHGEQLAISQDALNEVTGHRFARANARHGLITISPPLGDTQDIDPAEINKWIGLVITPQTQAQRGMAFETTRCQLHEVNISYTYPETGPQQSATITLEVETWGEPALTEVLEPALPVGEQPAPPLPPTVPPDPGLIGGQELVAALDDAGALFRTFDFQTASGGGGPTWDNPSTGITDAKLFSFVVDPFSPGYILQDGTGAINGWAAGETAIWRIEDIFGTPSATAQHTFATAISASSAFQSRTINASFGRFFATEAENPWLICVSHYADASGHTGTWATYSMDAGVTWASEVLISAHYDTDLSGAEALVVPGLTLSPRTPGLAYSAAYTETATPALASGYFTTDWGATWTAMFADDDTLGLLPMWGSFSNGGALVTTGPSSRKTVSVAAIEAGSVTGPGPGGTTPDLLDLVIAPPATTKRLKVRVAWSANRVEQGNSSSTAGSASVDNAGTTTRTGNIDYDCPLPPPDGDGNQAASASGTDDIEWNFTGGDWPINRTSIVGSPPANAATAGARVELTVTVNNVGLDNTTSYSITASVTVLEIELDDSTLFVPPVSTGLIEPGHRLGGDIHVPFTDNLDEQLSYYGFVDRGAVLAYKLMRADVDVSPNDGSRDYGVNRGKFSVRSHDSDRNYVLAGGIGNEVTATTAGDYVGLWVSVDAGDTWTAIVAPAAGTAAYRAAFGADAPDVIFAFGPPDTISYSIDLGSTLDDRAGNLPALGTGEIVGICGGPLG